MKNPNRKLQLSGFTAADGEFITYINNVQVEYCLLLKKIDSRFGDEISNFEIVGKVFSVPCFRNSTAKDIVGNTKYQYCRVVSEKNQRYIYSTSEPITDQYVLVSYRSYYIKDIINANRDISNIYEINRLINCQLLDSMNDTLNVLNKTREARTRK